MRIVIAGAGAIGGYVGARLSQSGADVVLFARGAHLQTMQDRGLRVTSPDGDFEAMPQVTGELSAIGQADVVFLGVKAHSLTGLAPALDVLFGPETVVVSTQNGIPWWYFQQHGGELEGARLDRVDPGGVIASAIEARRVVGSLAYFATDIVEPGVIRHTEGNRISLGEPDGTRSDRVKAIAEALSAAGFRCPITTRIRHEIWVKLLGNVAFNPMSALTGGTLVELARYPETSRLARDIMVEAEAVAAKLGIELPISVDQRMAGAEKVGRHKTSMLQDYEAGRPMEIEAVVGAVVELGERLGVETPAMRAVYACTKLLDEHRGERIVRPVQEQPVNPQVFAQELMAAAQSRRPMTAPSTLHSTFDLGTAYAVATELTRLRRAAGHVTVGRKVGFASKAVWRALKLETVVWAAMYDDTVSYARQGAATLSTARMIAPKIEPEIVFKLKRPITIKDVDITDPVAVLGAVEWLAVGFEIIDCVFHNWRFDATDFVAAFGLHAALVVGEPVTVRPDAIPALADQLARFTVHLQQDGQVVAEGGGKNVLRSPALCLGELAAGIARRPDAEPLEAGEIISSGTLTTSHPILPGTTWTVALEGLDVPGLSLTIEA